MSLGFKKTFLITTLYGSEIFQFFRFLLVILNLKMNLFLDVTLDYSSRKEVCDEVVTILKVSLVFLLELKIVKY